MYVVGVNGSRAGWLAVALDDSGDWDTQLFPTIDALWADYHRAALILVDIPIGLPDENAPQRECDRKARRALSPHRHNSIFPPPSRAALAAAEYEKASDINERITGRRLTKQAWNLAPKIREMDQLLRLNPRARALIRESHPELCFWALNGEQPLPQSKREADGQAARERLLAEVYPDARIILRVARARFRSSDVRAHDILDALVLAVTAALGHNDLHSLPESPPRDAYWLPQEIVYWPFKAAGVPAPGGA